MKKIAAKQIESGEGSVFVTRAELNAAANANQLKTGEVYLITDESRLAVGLSASTYETYAKFSETGGGSSEVTLVANGTINNNIAVALRSDGKVEAIAISNPPIPSFGEKGIFNAASTTNPTAVYDQNTKTIIVCYTDGGQSSYGNFIVGTVDTTAKTISWGAEGTFNAGTTAIPNAVYDPNTKTIVVCYDKAGVSGAYRVGTVEPITRTITWGTEATFNTVIINLTAVYDPNTQTIVVCFRDLNNANNGNFRVGTVEPITRTIAWGTEGTFNTGSTNYPNAVYDPNTKTIIVCYKDSGQSSYGNFIVGTVDTTVKTISWGTEGTFNTGITNYPNAIYDTNTKTIIVCYQDQDDSSKGNFRVGTVDTTAKTITWGTEGTFNTGITNSPNAVYDQSTKTIIVCYGDKFIVGTVDTTARTIAWGTESTFNNAGAVTPFAIYDQSTKTIIVCYSDNSTSGKYVCFTKDTTNARKFLGFSGNAATDEQNVVVKLGGAKLSGFSGLTPALPVYISDGGVVSHNNTTYPKVGVALSSTEILVANNSI